MKRQNLTDRTIRSLRPDPSGRRYEVMDSVVPGFGVRVSRTGKLTFILFTRYPGSKHPARRELGHYGVDTTLEKARDKARDWILLVRKGIDPSTPPGNGPRGPEVTFKAVVETYILKAVVGPDPKKPLKKNAKEIQRVLRVEFVNDRRIGKKVRRGLGDKPIGTIARADIDAVVDDAMERGATGAARHLLSIVRPLFNWAIDTDKYGLEVSPCDRMKAKRIFGEMPKRSRFHTDDEMTVIWPAAERLGYPYGPISLLLIQLGKRKSEVAQAQWREFDFKNKLWMIPGPRTKNTVADVVPLTDTATAILKSLPTFEGESRGDYLFSTCFGQKPVDGFSKAKNRFDELVREELAKKAVEPGDHRWPVALEPWVLHDFRRDIRTNLPRLGVPADIAELVLGHKKPGIRAVYDIFEYLDEKRDALERWECHLARLGLTFHRDSWTCARTPSLARWKTGLD